MERNTTSRDVYLALSEHNPLQIILFLLLLLAGSAFFFLFIALPLLDIFFREFLDAKLLYNGQQGTSYFFSWIIDINAQNGAETHYRLRPFLSFLPFSFTFGLAFAFYISSVLPPSIGYIRQKIYREIVNSLDKVARIIYHERVEGDHIEVERSLMGMDMRHLHEMAEIHRISFDELETLQKALKWRRLSGMAQWMKVQDGIRLYMRNYFTIEYNNPMLGIVYIGAAILIIIIGLRGLKFIPATEPSIIIFALELEFVLLICYAVTVIYTKDEEGQNMFRQSESSNSSALEQISSSLETLASREHTGPTTLSSPGSIHAREVENLLRIFINRSGKNNRA